MQNVRRPYMWSLSPLHITCKATPPTSPADIKLPRREESGINGSEAESGADTEAIDHQTCAGPLGSLVLLLTRHEIGETEDLGSARVENSMHDATAHSSTEIA